MGILLKTLRFFPVAAVVCVSTMLMAEVAFASDDLDRILGNTEEPFALCMQRCDEQTTLGRWSRRGCVPGCEQTRRNFSLRGRSFRSFQRCAEAVERVLLNRTRTIRQEQQWCRDNFTHLHHLRGCLDAVNVFYQSVSVQSICGRNPARPGTTPPVVVAPVPGTASGLVVARGPQPAATAPSRGQARATAPARAQQAVAATAAPMQQDTPKYQTKSSSKKKADAGAAKAKASKVPAANNGTLKKQPSTNATGKGLKALGTNGTLPKEKDAPFMPPAVNLEGVVPAPVSSGPVTTPMVPEKAPSAVLQVPSAPAPVVSGAAPALPLEVVTDSVSPATLDAASPAAPALAIPEVETPVVSMQQPAPALAAPDAVKAPEPAAPYEATAPSAVASVPAGNHDAMATTYNATTPVPPAPYVPLPETNAVQEAVQQDDPLPLLPELSRAEPPTELPPAPSKAMELPSINPLLK